MRVALDTSRITDLFRGDIGLAEKLGVAEEVRIPLFALGEIKAGFHGGAQRHRNERLLYTLLAKTTVGVLLPSRNTTRVCSFNSGEQALPFRDNDLWIAALVLEHDLILITRDAHFERIPQVIRA